MPTRGLMSRLEKLTIAALVTPLGLVDVLGLVVASVAAILATFRIYRGTSRAVEEQTYVSP